MYNKFGDYMYIKVNNKKIKILEYTKLKDRFKSLKFVLEKIDYGIKFPKRHLISTYFFCQKVDICITNKDNIIIKLYENIKSEKKKIFLKSYNIYYLPLNTCKYLKIGETLIPKEK